jgi:tRNA A-37 threonylcarbamoyl transferase component Bud32
LWSSATEVLRASITDLPVIYVGTQGPQRKAVCHMLSADKITSIVKVPLREHASRAILREGATLRDLERIGLDAPRLIEVDETRGTATQSWLPGRPTNRRFGAYHAAYLLALRTNQNVVLADFVDNILSARSMQNDTEMHGQARALLKKCRIAEVIPASVVHGDFSPWNLRLERGRLAACDWEQAQLSGLPLQDLAHFFVNDSYLFGLQGSAFERLMVSTGAQRVVEAVTQDRRLIRALFIYYCGYDAVQRLEQGDQTYARFLLTQAESVVL